MEYNIKTKSGANIFVNDLNPKGDKSVLFIHGWPANYNMFEYQYTRLTGKGMRCIGVDIRGFGKSSKPVSGYDYNTLSDDIRSVVNFLGLRNFTLLGHSTGGAIALRYMARHRGYGVSKLVLAASAAPSLVKRPDFPYGLDPSVVESIINSTYEDRPRMLEAFGEMFFYNRVSQPFSKWFMDLGLEAAGWSTIAISESWLKETLFDDLKTVVVPTMILHGIHDKVVPFVLGEIQQKGIKNARLIPFEKSGHGLFYDEKQKFNEELYRFVYG